MINVMDLGRAEQTKGRGEGVRDTECRGQGREVGGMGGVVCFIISSRELENYSRTLNKVIDYQICFVASKQCFKLK